MKIRIFYLGFIFLLGCAPILIGTGVATGYILSNDSASGVVDVPYRDLWDVCVQKLDVESTDLIEANESKGIIRTKMSGVDIAIKIYSLSSASQRLRVSARKNFIPKPYIAQDIFFGIVKELE